MYTPMSDLIMKIPQNNGFGVIFVLNGGQNIILYRCDNIILTRVSKTLLSKLSNCRADFLVIISLMKYLNLNINN